MVQTHTCRPEPQENIILIVNQFFHNLVQLNAYSNFELDLQNKQTRKSNKRSKPTYKNPSVVNVSRIASLGL
jgi:hypothetical protein